jgi:LysM repeat protein/lipoprotein-anchoring transpeptidase ErfK/SrfK
MTFGAGRFLLGLVGLCALPCGALGQPTPGRPAAAPRIEPGLERAVAWKWRVAPSETKDWGLELPRLPQPPNTDALTSPPAARQTNPASLYEIKRGDALILIGKKFGVSVAQIQELNGLNSDMIRAGQVLKIPLPAEPATVRPSPPPRANEKARSDGSASNSQAAAELEIVRLQVFLDREQFSPGPITGKPGPLFRKVLFLYQGTHEDAKDDTLLAAKAGSAVKDVFTHYTLKREDFSFIAPPKAETPEPKRSPPIASLPRKNARPAAITEPARTYDELLASSMLAYRSAWEFVAERFHCNESYLRSLNGKLPTFPRIGAEFRVPNVVPFEIEKALDEPLQPQPDPQKPVTAAIIGLSQLNIYRDGALVAVMPISSARPGLRGRGSWTILEAIPRPRLATLQEEWREPPKRLAPLYGSTPLEPSVAPPQPKLSSEQYLAAGPRNPAGVLWINLAKSDSKEPLPYGLHGTSVPDQMNVLESIGGFRAANWDIARAVRQLPVGTPLEWRPQ